MPGLSFVYPEMLWLLGVLPGLWALSLAAPRRLSPARLYGSLAVRSVLVAALVLAVAGAQLATPVERATTIFLIDASDSIAPSARAQAEMFVQEALRAMPADDQAAVVVFGGNALVDRAPDSAARLAQLSARPVATSTNIAEAVQLGLALFPADAKKRLVLISDGGENAGDALAAARLAAARGVPIEVVDLAAASGGAEVLVAGVAAPLRAPVDQEIAVEALVLSSEAQQASVALLADGALIERRVVELAAGENRLAFRVRAAGAGFQQYRVEVSAVGDLHRANNGAAAMVQVQGPPRVLVVAGDPADAAAIIAALAATNMEPELVTPAEMPADLGGLAAYEAMLLVNVPARAIPVGAMGAIPTYVRDLGKGLLMIGGEESFGVGGYGRTPAEEALPVYMDVRDREERPDIALVFVIDKSGSMDSCHCTSPDRRSPITGAASFGRKVDMAKEAVAQASALLGERDTVGVIGFDRQASALLPATRGATLDQVVGSMEAMQPRGSTNVRAGLLEAEEMLAGVDARIKHIVLLTDGWGSGGSNVDVAERLRAQGVTLTVVAAGGGSAGYLDELAAAGGGRYYPADDMAEVPQIFVQETITTVGNYIVERPFRPIALGESPLLSGLDGLPPLYGFNASTAKAAARQILVTDDEQPLLATWQYGLGRSAAWLSDTSGRWAADWVAWPAFPRFAAQLAGWVLPVRGGTETTTEVFVEGPATTVRLTLGANRPQLAGALTVTATLIHADGTRAELALPQTGPATYETRLASPPPGPYILQLAGADGERVLLHDTAGAVVPYSPEYGSAPSNPALLRRLAAVSGGQLLESGAESFGPLPGTARSAQEIGLPLLLLALALLPFDILLRRISVHARR